MIRRRYDLMIDEEFARETGLSLLYRKGFL
jgi:hypothetical protein